MKPTNYMSYHNLVGQDRTIFALDNLHSINKEWTQNGYLVPSLDREQQAGFIKTYADLYPAGYVFTSAPLDLANGKDRAAKVTIAEQAQRESRAGFSQPQLADLYKQLLQSDTQSVSRGDSTYKLLYNVSPVHAQLLPRKEYVDMLVGTDRAVRAEDGIAWLFVAIQVKGKPRNLFKISDLYDQTSNVATPELFARISKFRGGEGPQKRLYVLNEVIGKFGDLSDTKPERIVGIAAMDLEQRHYILEPNVRPWDLERYIGTFTLANMLSW